MSRGTAKVEQFGEQARKARWRRRLKTSETIHVVKEDMEKVGVTVEETGDRVRWRQVNPARSSRKKKSTNCWLKQKKKGDVRGNKQATRALQHILIKTASFPLFVVYESIFQLELIPKQAAQSRFEGE